MLDALAANLPGVQPAEMALIGGGAGVVSRVRSEALSDLLPWTRATQVGEFGTVHVRAIGRIDLLSRKVIDGRQRDLMDVEGVLPTRGQARTAIDGLAHLVVQRASPDELDAAIHTMRAVAGLQGEDGR